MNKKVLISTLLGEVGADCVERFLNYLYAAGRMRNTFAFLREIKINEQ